MEAITERTASYKSQLLKKAAGFGLSLPRDLEALAVVRGLRYYDVRNEGAELGKRSELRIPVDDFSYAEHAVALISPELDRFPDRLLRQRMASALLSHPDVDPVGLCQLADREGSAAMVRWIAQCGADVEPDEGFWKELLATLPMFKKPEKAPHPTRLMVIAGIVRGQKGMFRQWIRLGKASPLQRV